ncbi:MAG: septum formation initiator family protein [Clostridia bacterium]|nr:septum formation initiator family protein [Clostridia bacterium]
MKKRKKRNGFVKIMVVFSICLLSCLFYNKYSGLMDYNREIDSLNAQIAEQEEYGKELDKVSKEYASDEYVEKYARSLGLVKPNEKIFRNYSEK